MTDLPSRTEHIARGLAKILGDDSAAARALSELDNLRKQGEHVELQPVDDGWAVTRRRDKRAGS